MLCRHRRAQGEFLRDVAPILNKVGCTSGTCHGAAKGKNGFKLSLRGYDPQFDYEALLYDLGGRRFNRADPGTQPDAGQADAAGGARRRAALRDQFGLLQDHLQLDRAGCSVRRSGEATRSSELDVEPKEIFMDEAGRDRSSEDRRRTYPRRRRRAMSRAKPTSRATFRMSRPWHGNADVKGARIGEADPAGALSGKVRHGSGYGAESRARALPGSSLPQNNYIDELIDAKLQRLKIQPSPHGGRCGISAARVARSDRTVAGPERDSRVCGGHDAFAS